MAEACASGWLTPLGPEVDAFEREFAEEVRSPHAVALSSGTAALHLALHMAGVEPGDEVLVPTFTFVASVNPIRYMGARPVLLDCEPSSWNLDPDLLEGALRERAGKGRLPAAVIVVHLYGQTANMRRILDTCRAFDVPVVEDAAEALGATHGGRPPGSLGRCGVFSFNGNKIITTSGGGMFVTRDEAMAERARKLATQARDPAPHYQHSQLGYNYRLSNLLAAVGRVQLRSLDERVRRRREIFRRYRQALGDLPGFHFQPETRWGRHTRWLTCVLIEPRRAGITREDVRLALEKENVESRPLWKPMHLQPLYRGCPVVGGAVAEGLFARGLCLPSGSNLSERDQERVIRVVRSVATGEAEGRDEAAAPGEAAARGQAADPGKRLHKVQPVDQGKAAFRDGSSGPEASTTGD